MDTAKVGFIGLGNMGMAMARCLPKKGLQVTVYDLRKEAIEEMKALGARPANSCREVAEASDIVISMVRDIPQTDEVMFGKDGVWEGITNGNIIIISSSVGPAYCRELHSKAIEKGVRVVDCAVSDLSGTLHSIEGELTLMIGGDEADVKRCWPIFEAMGKYIFHLGDTGMGQAYKLVNNMAVFNIGAVNRECMNFGLMAGLNLEKMIEVLSVSTGGNWSLQFMGRTLKARKQALSIGAPSIRPVAPKASGGQSPQPKERQLAMEMAEAVGAPMPLSKYMDEINTGSVYDTYAATMKKYML